MELPCIFLWTKAREHFTLSDGFEETTNSELEILLRLNGEIRRSIEAEIEKRQIIVEHERSDDVANYIKKLQQSRRRIEILGRLDQRAPMLVETAATIMKTQQIKRESKIYQTFLYDIVRLCCSGGSLCAATLGKENVVSLTNQERIEVVHYFSTTRSAYESPVFNTLVEKYGIPHENGTLLIYYALRH